MGFAEASTVQLQFPIQVSKVQDLAGFAFRVACIRKLQKPWYRGSASSM
jgi:hypothetical protein